MNGIEYLDLSEKTLSNNFYNERVPSWELMEQFEDFINTAEILDNMKKSLYYGKGRSEVNIDDEGRVHTEDPKVLHALLGIITEAAELTEAYLKNDVVNMGEELGDLYWYMAILHRKLNTLPEETWRVNIEKLKARYGDKFSEDRAINRDLDREREILENDS